MSRNEVARLKDLLGRFVAHVEDIDRCDYLDECYNGIGIITDAERAEIQQYHQAAKKDLRK